MLSTRRSRTRQGYPAITTSIQSWTKGLNQCTEAQKRNKNIKTMKEDGQLSSFSGDMIMFIENY